MTAADWNAAVVPLIIFYLMFTAISMVLFLDSHRIVLPVGTFIGYTFWLLVYHVLLLGAFFALLH